MHDGHKMKLVSVWFLKVLLAVIAVSVPVAAIYDYARPWPEAVELLKRYPGGIRICVGYSLGTYGGGTRAGSMLGVRHARSFVMLPSVVWLPNIFTVERDGTGELHVGHALSDFLVFSAIYGSSIAGTWWLWVCGGTRWSRR